jgi:hypothetical protein
MEQKGGGEGQYLVWKMGQGKGGEGGAVFAFANGTG